jgi:hypothetical protein
MFPISILIATIAMASGVGGATFFSPLFILALGFPPDVAIGIGLITEVFGFASGVYAYAHKRLIDYKLGVNLLVATIPAAILGSYISSSIEPNILKAVLGVGLFAIALSFLHSPDHEEVALLDNAIQAKYGGSNAETTLITRDGEEIRYTVCNHTQGRLISGVGGLFVGLISTGLGEMNGYFLLQRCRVPSKVSVATSVFVVALTALAASSAHFVQFTQAGQDVLQLVFKVVVFTAPGVVIGGQLGTMVAQRISQRTMELGIAILFILVALLTLGEVVL